jgi:mannose-6-phosphate isomerase class I
MGLLTKDENRHTIPQALLYPLRFEPIYQYRLWGGRHLADLLTAPLPSGPIGEAWILSDRDDYASQVADGPLKGQTISQLLEQFPEQILGKLAHRFRRFPLLLKFLDVHEMLSVQVHPTKANTTYCQQARLRRPKLGSCWKQGHKAAFMRASSQKQRKPICGARSRTARWRITSHV